jgi:hypothetical protein
MEGPGGIPFRGIGIGDGFVHPQWIEESMGMFS